MKKKAFSSILLVFVAILVAMIALFAVPSSTVADASDEVYSATSRFIIDSQEDFVAFISNYSSKQFKNKTVSLQCDVSCKGLSFCISNFYGTFEGNGHRISDVTSPLFGTIATQSVNIQGRVNNLYITGSIRGCALANTNNGIVNNVTVAGTQYYSTTTAYNAIVGSNSGTMTGCTSAVSFTAYDSSGYGGYGAGIAGANSGTITDCAFVGEFDIDFMNGNRTFNLAGITVDNTGTVQNCAVSCDYAFTNGNNNTATPNIFVISGGAGNVTDSMGLYYHNPYSYTKVVESVPTVFNVTPVVAEGTITNSYGADSAGNIVYASGGVLVAGTAFDLISNNLGGSYLYATQYPMLSSLLDGSGTSVDPFLLSVYGDRYRTKISDLCDDYYYLVTRDFDLSKEENADYATGFTPCVPSNNASPFDEYNGINNAVPQSFGYVANDGVVITASAPDNAAAENAGSINKPYVINSAEQLKWLDGREGYAILNNDICLNSSSNHGHRLGIEEIAVTLYGNGHVIVGLTEEGLCETLSGSVSNLIIRSTSTDGPIASIVSTGTVHNVIAVINNDVSGLVATNEGVITKCTVYGSGASDSYAFCEENDGTITLCQNFATTTYAFTPAGMGSTEYCVNYAGGASTPCGDGNITASIDFENDTIYDDRTEYSVVGFGYEVLKEYESFGDFDEESPLGYAHGSNTPSIKVQGGKYKSHVTAFHAFTLQSNSYLSGFGYQQLNILSEICSLLTAQDMDVINLTSMTITYSNDTVSNQVLNTDVTNAGSYQITVNYDGNDYYFPAVYRQSFVINKASAPISISYDAGDFDPLVYTYDGEEHDLFEPSPSSASSAELTSYGYAYQYTLTKSDTVRAKYFEAGSYVQTVTATSVNYADITLSRKVTVNKKELDVTIGDLNCYYNSPAALSYVVLTLDNSDLALCDSALSAYTLLPSYNNYLTTSYTVGNNVGNYAITPTDGFYNLANNYLPVVSNGVLHVLPIEIPSEDVSFYGATSISNGATSVTYTSSSIAITATYANYLSATYVYKRNNETVGSVVNVGEYEVTATFSAANYNPLDLTVVLTVDPAILTLTAPSLTVPYKTAWMGGLTPIVTGYLTNDNASVIAGIAFDVELIFAANAVAVNTVLNAGEYVLHPTYDSTPINYVFATTDGVYTVQKIYLTDFYQNNSAPNTDFADCSKEYDGLAVSSAITYFANNELTVSINYSTKRGEDDYSDPVIGAGSYTVTATVTPTGALSNNYLPTTYVRRVVINKRVTYVTFGESSYSFEYSGQNYADINNFAYTDNLPSGATPVLSCVKNSVVTSAIDVDSYVITLSWAGNDNEEACSDSATLIVTPKPVTLGFTQEYTYSGLEIVPVLTWVSVGSGPQPDISQEDLSFSYYDPSGTYVEYIIHANSGNYTFVVTLPNGNYALTENTFTLKVNKATFDVVFGTLSCTYGYYGQYEIDGNNYTINPYSVTRNNYVISGGPTVNLTVSLPSSDAGEYALTNDNLSDTNNYDYSFAAGSTNVVRIVKRTLNVVMKIDNVVQPGGNSDTEYIGVAQNSRFTFAFNGFASGDGDDDIDVVTSVKGISEANRDQIIINNVGTYRIKLTLTSANYILDGEETIFTVNVEKARLEISVGDVIVQEREALPSPVLTLSGLVGSDIGLSASALRGSRIGYVTDYNTSSRAGSVYGITVSATFDNYTPVIKSTGKVSVVANDYPEYTISDAAFVYDGSYKRIEIPNVHPDVNVVYSNNSHRDAGSYWVSAKVTYPSGREENLFARMTIAMATPTMNVPRIDTIYSAGTTLTDDLIIGRALVGDVVEEGTFSFTESHEMQEGIHSYEYLFVPLDRKNVRTFTGMVEVNAVAVNMSVFEFSPATGLTYTSVSDSEASVTANTVTRLTIAKVLDGLILCRDGHEVDYVEFSKNEDVVISVKYNDKVVFSATYKVKYADANAEEAKVIDSTSLVGTGLTVEGKIVKVNEGGGRIALAEDLKIDYNLFVNGYATDSYIINGNEGTVTVIIRSKANNKTVYSDVFTVVVMSSEEEIAPNYTMYYIIGGVAGGLLIVGGIILFLWKRKNG